MSEFIDGQGIACACVDEGCTCTGEDEAILRLKTGVAMCSCCMADCPDVHPEGGIP